MKYTPPSKTSSKQRGVVLLIAVLVASVVLAVGIGVYQRTYKELYFSSFWKQTQLAAAAADSGLECALFWELHPADLVSGKAQCSLSYFPWNPAALSPWSFDLDTDGGGCASVTIIKPALSGLSTHIEARGYNSTCLVKEAGTNPRIVERGLYMEY